MRSTRWCSLSVGTKFEEPFLPRLFPLAQEAGSNSTVQRCPFEMTAAEIVNEIPGRHSARRSRLPTRSSIMLLVFIPVSSTFSFSFLSPPLIPLCKIFSQKKIRTCVQCLFKKKKILDIRKTDFTRSFLHLRLRREFLNEIDGKNRWQKFKS